VEASARHFLEGLDSLLADAKALFDQDRKFEAEGTHWIILFDALDRSSSDWTAMNALIRGLLEVALELRPYRRLRVKCFLRTGGVRPQREN
jgi:hypothetical protein